MEVLEAIRNRRTTREPFAGEPTDSVLVSMKNISAISPFGGPVSWRLVRVEDHAVRRGLAAIVQKDFGNYFQKNKERFRQVFSEYPKWLRFSPEAEDGIRLLGLPPAARAFYGIALGKRIGPAFGKLGIMDGEIRSYCRNILSPSALFGVFLDRNARSAGTSAIVNAGGMLQNLRLAATASGACYQDLGWITATRTASDKARRLLNMPEQFAAVNFFRVGHADGSRRPGKQSDFRRKLGTISHDRTFGVPYIVSDEAPGPADAKLLDTIRGAAALKESESIGKNDLTYALEAARWAPTGFNVQPFEFIVVGRETSADIIVLENRDRRDPDPGPCEALARGGLFQNIRLAARARGLDSYLRVLSLREGPAFRQLHGIPERYSIIAEMQIGRTVCKP